MSFAWKVCGMREPENIQDVLELTPDMLGFIFYEKSKRYVGPQFRLDASVLSHPVKRVGVFVNHSVDFIFSQVQRYRLDFIQLHGDESAEFCREIKSPILRGARDISPQVKTIKALAIDPHFDFARLAAYETECDYFLFDTKTPGYGGSGKTFDWHLLKQYSQTLPFFLSGGISLDNISELLTFIHENPLNLFALDINSQFEISPGLKDLEKLKKFKQIISTHD